MSLFSSIVIPELEAELTKQGPEIAAFLVKQVHVLATEALAWAEIKMQGAKNEAS